MHAGLIAAALAAAALLALVAAPARAATLVVPSGSGVTLPSGMTTTPDGALWEADAELGLCRVGLLPGAPGIPAEAPTCGPKNVPDSAGQVDFDPVSENFYVADNKSTGGGVWRMHWDAATGTIDAVAKIYDAGTTGARVQGLAVTPDGDVDFTNLRDVVIRRIGAPDTATPDDPIVVGFSRAKGATSLAYLGGALYLAEPSQAETEVTSTQGALSRLLPSPTTPGPATVVPGLRSSFNPTAIASDPADGRLYLGSFNDLEADDVAVLKDGVFHDYDQGYSNITAMHVGAGGTLFVSDDPLSGAFGQDSIGRTRIFSEPRGPLDRPRVTIGGGPHFQDRAMDAVFAFGTRAGAHTECRFDGSPWAACNATWTAAGLTEGMHWFEARGIDDLDPTNIGVPTRYAFTTDRTGPQVRIVAPAGGAELPGPAFDLRFDSDEPGTSFTCSINGGPAARCASPRRYGGAPGWYTAVVRGTDRAGNVSAPVTVRFAVGRAPVAAPTFIDAPAEPSAKVATACVSVAPLGASAKLRLSGKWAILQLDPPAGATLAKVTLRAATKRAPVVATLGYVKVGGDSHSASIALTHGQRTRIRRGKHRIALAYGTCRTSVGGWQWASDSATRATGRTRKATR